MRSKNCQLFHMKIYCNTFAGSSLGISGSPIGTCKCVFLLLRAHLGVQNNIHVRMWRHPSRGRDFRRTQEMAAIHSDSWTSNTAFSFGTNAIRLLVGGSRTLLFSRPHQTPRSVLCTFRHRFGHQDENELFILCGNLGK